MKSWKLSPNHPVITDGDICPLCKKPFEAGELITLVPARQPEAGKSVETVPAIVVHEACAKL